MVIDERDVDRAATYLVNEYGELASPRAKLRAAWLRRAGDVDGYRTWSRLAEAVLRIMGDEDEEDTTG